jgi:hypothetical protein
LIEIRWPQGRALAVLSCNAKTADNKRMNGALSVSVILGGALVAGAVYQGLLSTRRGRVATGALALVVAGLAIAAAISQSDVGYVLFPLVFPILQLAKVIKQRGMRRLGFAVLRSGFLLFALAASLVAYD